MVTVCSFIASVHKRPADEPDSYDYNPTKRIKRSVPLESKKLSSSVKQSSKHKSKPILVLDLDETLVHCSPEPIKNAEKTFNMSSEGHNYTIYVKFRPFLDFFLKEVSQVFDLMLFTASQQSYAGKVLGFIDPNFTFFKNVFYRESCKFVNGQFFKDLSIITKNLSRICIIDNSPNAYSLQVENGIPITSYFGDSNDLSLLDLLPFLKSLSHSDDFREVIRERFLYSSYFDDLSPALSDSSYEDSSDDLDENNNDQLSDVDDDSNEFSTDEPLEIPHATE